MIHLHFTTEYVCSDDTTFGTIVTGVTLLDTNTSALMIIQDPGAIKYLKSIGKELPQASTFPVVACETYQEFSDTIVDFCGNYPDFIVTGSINETLRVEEIDDLYAKFIELMSSGDNKEKTKKWPVKPVNSDKDQDEKKDKKGRINDGFYIPSNVDGNISVTQ